MGSEDDDDDDRTFGVTRRIMLAAVGSLVGVVMLMILLHLYARYLLRRQERRRQAELYGSRTDQSAPVGEIRIVESPKTGLDPLVIASLPMFTYAGQVDEPKECSVCLGSITEESIIRLLPNCNHVFHVQCIDTWLGSHTTCPVCRTAAEPTVQLEDVESVNSVRPTAPPIEEHASHSAAQVEKDGGPSGSGSGSRFGSFRWMLGRQRSSNRIQNFEDHEIGGAQHLER
ncbi:pentatricopeptide repeat-containing protein [Hibiscus syriacus]|uniref:RING-type E3 ubiquitin transferase n=1 Tax=Hibiscus syriacus TaxID=106335 RepID=A0A6A2YA27_HIBSY|nr:E3 ubiquitin-protein ligase ATL41-like [Hibiscus syriacus]KAE8674256.1 pentatricopeptide repeat-containing protein [Hibiscus syriacus]